MERCLKMVIVAGTLLLRRNINKRKVKSLKRKREEALSNQIGNLYNNNHKKYNRSSHQVKFGSNTTIAP